VSYTAGNQQRDFLQRFKILFNFLTEVFCLKRKILLYVVLSLVLSFGVVLATYAAQPTAKDLVLLGIKNFDTGINKAFYEKSQDVTSIKITGFDGSLTTEAGQIKGASIDLVSQLDASNNVAKVSYTTDITGKTNSGSIYLKDDKVIFTKDIFILLKLLGLDAFKDVPYSLLEQNHEYYYFSDEQLKSIWEQLSIYQDQQLPEEYKESLLFLVEAIPDQYFSMSTSKVTLELDKNGLEDVIYNLLTKIKDEKERAADIVININKSGYAQMGTTPEQMKKDIIESIDSMPVITREEIKLASSFLEIKKFTYEASILPGGPKNFNMDLGFKAPDDSVEGQFAVVVGSVGTEDDLKVSYSVSAGFNVQDGPKLDFLLDCLANYKAEVAYTDINVKAVAMDNTTGDLLLNFGATANSTTEVEHNLIVNVPELNDANSIDLTYLLTPEMTPDEAGFIIVVNGITLDTEVSRAMKDNGEIMVPARAVLEALGCEVKWVAPNEVYITAGEKSILIFINESNYQVNGLEKTLSVPAYLEKDFTMIPVGFLVEELGAEVEFVSGVVIITK
jgi:hypothetical protein